MRLLISLSLLLSVSANAFSMQRAELPKAPKTVLTAVSSHTPIFDAENYCQMLPACIAPEFIGKALTSPPHKILDICAGMGLVLQQILEQQTIDSPPLDYTVVELFKANMQTLKDMYKKTSKAGVKNRLGCSQKDIVDFLQTNPEKKANQYESVLASFALHVLDASSYVKTLDGLFSVTKEGGKLFLTQHCTLNGQYHPDYIQKVKRGDLIPFWCADHFYSDPETMTDMLKAFGFEIEKIGIYADIHPNKTITRYLGLTAVKKSQFRENNMVKKYYSATQQLIPLEELKPLKVIELKQKSYVANYETYLICAYSQDISELTQVNFNIHRSLDEAHIGQILLQYYPQGGYYKTGRETPTLRLRHIEIDEGFRQQHHATRALETLFTQLRKSSALPKDVEVWLEYSTCYPYLGTLYKSFGFKNSNEPSIAETKVLRVELSKTKFPYYRKIKDSLSAK